MKNRHHFSWALIATIWAGLPTSAKAHDQIDEHSDGHRLHSAVALTWRSAAAVNDQTAWRLPGFLMGGETWPADEGVAIDEASLFGNYAVSDSVYAVGKAGLHNAGKGNDHGNAVELQHLYMGWKLRCSSACIALEAGKMPGLFTPSAAEHASVRPFSESALTSDLFFGRDFHDQGVRVLIQTNSGISGGVEHWRGQQFPATPTEGDGTTDIFIRYGFHSEKIALTFGAWSMRADATARIDRRYSAAHSHSTNRPVYPAVEFNGVSDLHGLHSNVRWNFTHVFALSVSGEWVTSEADGFLQNNQRVAQVNAQGEGYWVQPALHWHKHMFAIRAEQLRADNYLQGPGAPALNIESGLSTHGHLPKRLSALWRWQWQKNIALRAEFIDDQSLPGEASRFNVGVVWQQSYR